MSVKIELQNIISGNGEVRFGSTIQTINNYLRREKEAVSSTTNSEFKKAEETACLLKYIHKNNLWYESPDESKYIGEGAEQKIYEHDDPDYVLKLNSTVYYEYWKDYFNNLLLHNYFFPHLAYELLGFYKTEFDLFAVVRQPYVRSTETTNLDNIRIFILENGFINKKTNDYFHPELGIILEDLHDENVLTEGGVLQFIDTVFYLTPLFYMKE
jgi:hypothetical protein